jgi:hypothetical protein
VREFFEGFVNYVLLWLQISSLRGVNALNQFETIPDAFGRAQPHLMMSVRSVLLPTKKGLVKSPFFVGNKLLRITNGSRVDFVDLISDQKVQPLSIGERLVL